MKLINFFIGFVSLLNFSQATPSTYISYNGQKVIEFKFNTKLKPLLDILDIWSYNKDIIQARVTPSQLKQLKQINEGMFDYKIIIDDIQKYIDLSFKQNKAINEDWFNKYHKYEEIKAWFDMLANTYPNIIKVVPSIGKTVQGRDLFAIHLTSPNDQPKKRVYMQSLIHAREWISGSTLQYVIHYLLTHQNEIQIQNFFDQLELVIIPVVNPDGYAYSWKTDRLWRKNRSKYDEIHYGADLNRNFPYGWGGPGSSDWVASDAFRGSAPASELETQHIMKYYEKLSPFVGAIDWHCYSELILRPYGTTSTPPENDKKLAALGDIMVKAIASVNSTQYSNIRSYELYAASGIATDYFYSITNKTFSYTIELSPKGGSGIGGFILPPEKIKVIGNELVPAVLKFLEYTLSEDL